MIPTESVDLMYLACNRLEFTRETFSTLISTTDWEYVRELVVYDDGSTDGTLEWLEQNITRVPAQARLVRTSFGSPVSAMRHFIEHAVAPMLAKTDNDAMLPPGWLRQSLEVMEDHPELTLLGIEAMYLHVDDTGLRRSFTSAIFMSGLGLYRRSAFAHSRPHTINKWFGLEEWQMAQGDALIRGWITPAIPVFLLDRMPIEPWSGYSRDYIARGWQRTWPPYDADCTLWEWAWKPESEQVGAVEPESTAPVPLPAPPRFKVVILSATPSNLISCIESVLKNEPDMLPGQIVVVDDGVRSGAEEHLPGVHWVTGVKPFNFARNANLGIAAAGSDVILLNDDAQLLTPYGFTRLAETMQARGSLGICSAGIKGSVGNSRQIATTGATLRIEPRTLAFICVYIPATIYAQLGVLDDRFSGYGFEDNDYCTRARAEGLELGIWDGCVVDHSGSLPSTFRTRPDLRALFRRNQMLYRKKWGRNA
jgi:GT2 family glycosyltransferase